jgi:hypothetical protein
MKLAWLEALQRATWLSLAQVPTSGTPFVRIASQSSIIPWWRTSRVSAPKASLSMASWSLTPPSTPGWLSCAG